MPTNQKHVTTSSKPSLTGLNLRERFKGVAWISVIVAVGLVTFPPVLAFIIVAVCADEYFHIVCQLLRNLHTYTRIHRAHIHIGGDSGGVGGSAVVSASSSAAAVPRIHHIVRIEQKQRLAFILANTAICISALYGEAALNCTALMWSLLLCTWSMFRHIEQGHAWMQKDEGDDEGIKDDDEDEQCAKEVEKEEQENVGNSSSNSSGKSRSSSGTPEPIPLVNAPSRSLLLHKSPLSSAYALVGLVVVLFGMWYVGWMFGHGILLLRHDRSQSLGIARVLYVIFLTAAGENGGMVIGKLFGQGQNPSISWLSMRLARKISPKKSMIGGLAQVVASALGSVVWMKVGPVIGLPHHAASSCLIGSFIGIVALLGDLFESLLKRSIGVKDAGRMIPGAGGMMDRMDGLVFAFPAMYYLIRFQFVA